MSESFPIFLFSELGIWVRPRKARALVWNNMDENGRCEPMSIHKANKVEKGRKIILQRWYVCMFIWAASWQNQQNDVQTAKTRISLGIRPVFAVHIEEALGP